MTLSSDKGAFFCFGELLLRLGAPGYERLLQTNALQVHVGGAEANVAAALAQFGARAEMVSVVPRNALGDAAIRTLRGLGVGTDRCRRGDGRMGLYFLSAGAVMRPSEILYDRAGSAFAMAAANSFAWDEELEGATWLHISGITPAVSANATEAALAVVRFAAERGLKVSFDGNYRAKLWKAWRGHGPGILGEILSKATIAFIDHRDVSLLLERSLHGTPEVMRDAARAAAFEAFPSLQMIASMHRMQTGANDHSITASLATRERTFVSREAHMSNVVDRIGGGDAFAAGVLFSLNEGVELQRAVDFGLAASALKHSIPGDMLIASREDVESQMNGEGLDVRR